MDLAVTGWDQERLLDRRDDAATEQRCLRDDGERGVHPVTVDSELAVGCSFDDAILQAAIQAAPQVIPREPRLNTLLDADAVRRERHRLGIVGGKRIDVSIGRRDAVGVGNCVHSLSIG